MYAVRSWLVLFDLDKVSPRFEIRMRSALLA
jgi:hypothetical protein